MLEMMKQAVLSTVISLTIHKVERLNNGEEAARNSFMEKIQVPKRKTKQAIIVAMVGLVGSGKSSVARALAPLIGAAVINGDDIRLELRERGERYDKARMIAENAAMEVIRKGGNVVLDSDAVDSKKRASLQAKAKKAGAQVAYLRVYAERDTMIGRLISAEYPGGGFFKNATIAIREMWRRTPLHYRWSPWNGGVFDLKRLPVKLLGAVDTTDERTWPKAVEQISQKMTALF